MLSMTGYGLKSLDTGRCRVSVRIRSVNHRFLDIVLKMPDDSRHLEIGVRQHIADRVSRGRLEVRLDIEDRREKDVQVAISKSWIQALKKASDEMNREGLDAGELRIRDLLRIPGALRVSSNIEAEDSDLDALVMSVIDGALDELLASRTSEGIKLQTVLAELLSSLAEEVKDISSHQEEVRRDLEGRFRERLAKLGAEMTIPDEVRISHEIAVMIDRSDIREELDRLGAHQTHFQETMNESGAKGKKLDFIAQEMARELTTLAAKCRHTSVVQKNVDAKLICEQIREQIQNIE